MDKKIIKKSLNSFEGNLVTETQINQPAPIQCISITNSYSESGRAPVFVGGGHSACVGGAGHGGDGRPHGAQVLDDRGEELLTGALVQVEADLVGHQQVVLLHQLLQDVADGLGVVQEDQALRRETAGRERIG